MIRLKWTRLSPLILGCVLVSGGLLAAESEQEAGKDPDQALESLLVGEFEGQEGDSRRAARKYIDAARASDDPALAERAASIAFATGDGELAREALARWRELAPERVGVLVLDAGLALRESRIDDAERDLLSLIRQPPDGWKHALRAMLGSANADASALVLARILDARALPEDASAWLAFGGLAQRLGVAEPEQRWLATLTERFPDDPRIALLQAGHLRRSGDREAALSAVRGAVERLGDDETIRIAAAAELESLEQPNEADQLLARGPQSAAILTARASILNRAGDRQALAELYRQAKTIAAETPSPELGLLLGQLAEALEQREDALAWYAEVPPDGPGATQAVLRSVFVLAEVGRLEEGLARLHGIQGSESTDRDSLRDAFLFEGELLLDAERPDAALDAYTRGLERLPADPELRYARALAHERRDDIASAEAELRAMLADDPENINALNALGYTLADRTERFDEAMELIERALTMAPENAAVIDSMGWVLFRKGRVEEALPYLRRAFELLPDAEVAAHLGEALWVGERLDEARSVWREGLRVDPEHRVLIGTLRRLAPDLLP